MTINENNTLSLSVKKQKHLIITLCLLLAYQPIVMFIKSITIFTFSLEQNLDTILIYLILISYILRSIWIILTSKKINLDTLLLFLLFIGLYLLSIIINTNNLKYLFTTIDDYIYNPFYHLFVFSLPAYLIIRHIDQYQLLISYLTRFSVIVVLLSIYYYFIFTLNNHYIDYMTFSYNMLVPILTITIISIKNKNIPLLFIGIIGFILVLIAGARGPLLVYVICMLTFIITGSLNPKKLGFRALLISLIVIILVLLSDEIIGILINLSQLLNIESRTLELILDTNFLNLSGREGIYIDGLSNLNLLGYGLFGDRIILSGTYPHNIFIELSLHFGVIIGFMVSLLFVIYILKTITSNNRNIVVLSIIFLSLGFFKLLISGTYLNEPSFFITLGLIVNNNKNPAFKIKTSEVTQV